MADSLDRAGVQGAEVKPATGDFTIADGLARRRDNFLLLRILAACAVIYGHSFAIAPQAGANDIFLRMNWGYFSGALAVDVFFVVSGFLVSGSFMARHSLGRFVLARALRILPALAVVLLGSIFVIGPLFTRLGLAEYFAHPGTRDYFFQNIVFSRQVVWGLPGVFETGAHPAVNGSLWTLPAEVRMYALVAVLGALGFLRRGLWPSLLVVGLLLLGILHPEAFPANPRWMRPAGYFLLGILAQLNKDRIGLDHARMLVLAALAVAFRDSPAYPYLFALALAYFCFWFAYCTPVWKGLERWGDPSYGIYLWGWPMQKVFVHNGLSSTPLTNCLWALPAAICLGYLSWRLVEKPCLRFKNLRLPRFLLLPRSGTHRREDG